MRRSVSTIVVAACARARVPVARPVAVAPHAHRAVATSLAMAPTAPMEDELELARHGPKAEEEAPLSQNGYGAKGWCVCLSVCVCV
jgi:hypothetical protein